MAGAGVGGWPTLRGVTIVSVAPGWADPQWRATALDWVTGQLDRHGRRVTGPVEARQRPWSLVWQVPTDAGPYWFKANNPGTAYEAVLLAELPRLAPGLVLDPVAVDPARGWSLLPHGGPSLRDLAEPDPTRWADVLAAYANLQRTVSPLADDLVALGVPDHRPAALPALLAGLLDDRAALLLDPGPGDPDARPEATAGDGDGSDDGRLDAATYERLRAYQPRFTEDCGRLADTGIPASVQHDDLHDGNVFAADGYRFFDWGDASVAYPFGTLLVTLRSVAHTYSLPEGDPVLLRLRDAYLEAWTDRHDRAALREAAGLAVRVTTVSRALSWRRALATTDPGRAEYADAVPGWLGELFAPMPV
ncbi:aminoglycoside phosphotransferase family protein [Micromonospora sp. MMS20-R2-29]|uniref:Aminoglycoside phosphotransferase family protein n=1 Tax=Micromonospora humidisoli TaxID=2807622 RepID=A0ABS2JBR2_9ACTN|nr:aminoglycoside phosphotransferase family protein [Micromonospora humidisoli]